MAAVFVPGAVEAIWMAINDEEHHALDDRFMPVEHSEVLEGRPRGEQRLLFQYLRRWGTGRWWVSRVEMNRELFDTSAGRLWELRWKDEMTSVDRSLPAIRAIDGSIKPIRESEGAWLLVPLADDCTLVEYYTRSDPGGAFVGLAQSLMMRRALRDTLAGVMTMAEQHVAEPHPDAVFVRPDGRRLAAR